MKTSKLFDGFNVFISRHLFPPHEFDTVLKAVEENGGQVHIGFDLSRNGENDYHIISCRKHYKFQDLKSKGCKMIGYRCVLQCAKEGRPLPRQAAFTCCLTMEAVKILAYGFDADQMVLCGFLSMFATCFLKGFGGLSWFLKCIFYFF